MMTGKKLTQRIGEGRRQVIAHARYTIFQMAEVAVPRDLFHSLLMRRQPPATTFRTMLTADGWIYSGFRQARYVHCVAE
ncbi:anthranilate/para-aminobenzoate synthase component II [Azospirillum agricola]|nr:anthranilate/para-aminobenzoate synthase component II [Azospirillum agricola]